METLSTLILSMVLVSLWLSRYFSPRQDASSFWKSGWCMISLSCIEIRWSIWAMRALIIASVSGATVMEPFEHLGHEAA